MWIEWDATKARANLRKHDVEFELAGEVFDDPFVLFIEAQTIRGEERWVAIGRVANLAILYVVFTEYEQNDEEVIRIISARKATARERRLYEETHW